MNSRAINYYHQHALSLAKQYNQLSFEQVHHDWCDLIPRHFSNRPLVIADIGAGSGRDARALAALNPLHRVWAVEPAKALAQIGQAQCMGLNVTWLADQLPELAQLHTLPYQFDLILLSAVWMHLAPVQRQIALRSLASLLAKQGLLVISLRHGHSEQEIQERQMFEVTAQELIRFATNNRLTLLRQRQAQTDQLQRRHVYWETLVFIKE